ncbi:MAG: hypothetical protein NT003_02115 [Candidatus Magasanikbacteria bacterium]|nr:hypothetical protein [Candidatus Magasanikbacteria bacterium]
MAKTLTPHRLGLVLGAGLAFMHAVWALAVAVSPSMVQAFYNWILGLHFITLPLTINQFEIGKALMLVIVTGIAGYLIGLVFGWAHKLLEE